jgi:SAM-dependent methyltransferase
LTAAEYEALRPSYDPGDVACSDAVLDLEQRKALILRHAGERRGSLLDVGCGVGGYLVAARELGFDVLGVEPSAAHVAVGRERLGLPILNGYFDPSMLGDRKFNVIILSHVIEHILDPKPFIASLLSALTSTGVLIILTPNSSSLAARALGKRWPMLRPPDHVTMLSTASVPHLLPSGYRAELTTSEHSHEYATNIASAVRDWARSFASPVPDSTALSPVAGASLPAKLVRYGLAAASAPFYLAARATGRASTIIATISAKLPASPAGHGRARRSTASLFRV